MIRMLRDWTLRDAQSLFVQSTDKQPETIITCVGDGPPKNARSMGIVLLAGVVGSCTQTPSLDREMSNLPFSQKITTSEVVERVKCELAKAIKDKIPNPAVKSKSKLDTAEETQFRWMRKWTVKADLTLSMNEEGSLSPSAAFLRPLKNVYNPGIGPSSLGGSTIPAVAQSFTFGVGGGYTAQATRSNILTFALSFAELRSWYSEAKCPETDGAYLQGSLDLNRWINEALAPVQNGDLRQGNHVAPTGVSPAKAPKATADIVAQDKTPSIQFLVNEFSKFDGLLPKGHHVADVCSTMFSILPPVVNETLDPSFYVTSIGDAVGQSISAAKQANDSVAQANTSVKNSKLSKEAAAKAYKQLHEMANVTEESFLAKVNTAAENAKTASDNAEIYGEWTTVFSKPAIEEAKAAKSTKFDELGKAATDTRKKDAYEANLSGKMAACAAKMTASEASKAAQNLTAAKATPNPPIDTTSQSVDFIVMANINASPSWSLINLKGPGNVGNLLSINGIRTHTLDIAIGPPGANGAKTSAAQDTALLALKQARVVSTLQSLGVQ